MVLMTPYRAVRQADRMRPNDLSMEDKIGFVYELEGRIAQMMGKKAPVNLYDEGIGEDEYPPLLVKAPHDEVYKLYVAAKIDLYNEEGNLYENDMAAANAVISEIQAKWRREHMPPTIGNWRVM